MKTRLFLPGLLVAALCLAGSARAAAKDAPKEPDNRPELAVVVSESLGNAGSAVTEYTRLDLAFQKMLKKRNWPVKIVTDRFAANTPDHDTEIQIFCQPLRREPTLELVFRGWVTLQAKGKKHDFGLVTYRYNIRLGEADDETIDKVYLGAANAIADKVEPLLFPELKADAKK